MARASAKSYTANPAKSIQAVSDILKQSGRTSLEDVAESLTQAFGGAEGFAEIMKELTFAPAARPATQAKILSFCMSIIERASKQYGDRAKLDSMSREQIEERIGALLAKHDFVIPIHGAKLDVVATP